MEVLNVSRQQIEVEIITGETVFLLPKQKISGVTDESYNRIKDYVRVLCSKFEKSLVDKENINKNEVIDLDTIEEIENNEIVVIDKPKKSKRRGRKKKNG